MSWKILSACGWDSSEATTGVAAGTGRSKVSLVQQHFGVDGDFLLIQLLIDHLRANAQNRVLFITAYRTPSEHIAACKKLTFPAEKFIESGALSFVDVLAEVYKQCGNIDSSFTNTDGVGMGLITLLKSRIETVFSTGNTLVIVDDIGFYLAADPSTSENDMIDFAEELVEAANPGIGHIVLMVKVADTHERMCAHLVDLAQMNIILETLPSGQFGDVHGRLTVYETNSASGSYFVHRRLRCMLLYKVGDRKVHTFLPGELGITNL